jgi:hypothetical protein
VILGQQSRIARENGEQLLDNLIGMPMRFFHSRGIVEICQQEILGYGAVGFHRCAESREASGRAPNVIECCCADFGNADAHSGEQVIH